MNTDTAEVQPFQSEKEACIGLAAALSTLLGQAERMATGYGSSEEYYAARDCARLALNRCCQMDFKPRVDEDQPYVYVVLFQPDRLRGKVIVGCFATEAQAKSYARGVTGASIQCLPVVQP